MPYADPSMKGRQKRKRKDYKEPPEGFLEDHPDCPKWPCENRKKGDACSSVKCVPYENSERKK
jgi:hypothetical protein